MTQTKAELLQTRHQGDIRLGDANSSNYVGFKAPATVSSSLVWTLPAADGTANYLLKTDGSGNLAWTADNSGVSLSGSTNNTIATVTGANALTGEANLTYDGTDFTQKINSSTAYSATATPQKGFQVQNEDDTTNSFSALRLTSGSSSPATAQISSIRTGTGQNDLAFQLETGNNAFEAMRITSAGRLLLGTTTEGEANADNFTIADSGHCGISIRSGSSSNGGIYFSDGTSGTDEYRGYIIYNQPNDILQFATGSVERIRIGSSGQIGSGGATFGSSGQVLTSGGSGAAVSWADAAGGGATPTVKTANYTAASGDMVVVNGTGLTITLPSGPSAGDFVKIRILGDRYCTVARNSQNINGSAEDLYVDVFDGCTTLTYADSTRGWLVGC